MRKTIILLTALAALALPAPASAVTLELASEPTPQNLAALERARGFVAESRLPWPDTVVPVVMDVTWCGGGSPACAGFGGSVYVTPSVGRLTLLHELAHAAIDPLLTEAERGYWTSLMADAGLLPPGTDGWADYSSSEHRIDGPPAELFAEAWSDCAAPRWNEWSWGRGGYGYDRMTREQRERTCAWLSSVADGKGWALGAVAAESQSRECGRVERAYERHGRAQRRHRRAYRRHLRSQSLRVRQSERRRSHRRFVRKHRKLKRQQATLKRALRAAC